MNRSPWFTALLHPLNLIILCISVAAGLLSAWWLFPIGLLFWGIMVTNLAFDPAARLNQIIQGRTILPERFQIPFKRIERGQISLYNTLISTRRDTRSLFGPVQQAMNEMVDETHKICLQMTPLENNRQVTNGIRPESELAQLNRLVNSLEDPEAKQEYENAITTLQSKVAQSKAIEMRLTRLDAFLSSQGNEIDQILTISAQIQGLPPSKARVIINELIQKIRKETEDVREFSKTQALF